MAIIFEPGLRVSPGISITAESAAASGSANFVSSSSQYLGAKVTQFSTLSFTTECWFYQTNSTGIQGIMNARGGASTGSPSTSTGFDVSVSGGAIIVTNNTPLATPVLTGGSVSLNTWNHIAVTRTTGSVATVYLNGTSIGTFSRSTSTSSFIWLGVKSDTAGEFFNGYISNFRYAQLVVYTGNFTVPTAPLTATQSAGTNIAAITGTSTKLLLNTVYGAGFLTDSSTFNVSVTNYNGVTSSALNPFG
jgi:hypothetical protein